MRQWVLTDTCSWMRYGVVFKRCSEMPLLVKGRELSEEKLSVGNAAFRPYHYNVHI